jgi:hypothetical protein
MADYTKYATTAGNLEATMLAIDPRADLAVTKQLAITFHMSVKLTVWASGDLIIQRIRLKDIGLNAKLRLDQFLASSYTAISYYTPGYVWVSVDCSKKDLSIAVEEIRQQDDHHVLYNQWIELRHETIVKTANSEEITAKVYNLNRACIDCLVFDDCCVPATSVSPLIPGKITFNYRNEPITLYYKTRNAAEAAYFDILEALPY